MNGQVVNSLAAVEKLQVIDRGGATPPKASCEDRLTRGVFAFLNKPRPLSVLVAARKKVDNFRFLKLPLIGMRKAFRLIGLAAVLFAAGNIVLHAAHLDDSHLRHDGHDCSLCQVLTSGKTPSLVLSVAPSFVPSDLVLPFFNAHPSNILSFLKENRGPPLAELPAVA